MFSPLKQRSFVRYFLILWLRHCSCTDMNITICNDTWFGVICDKQCWCLNITEICNKSTGVCLSGCRDAKLPPDCQRFPGGNGDGNNPNKSKTPYILGGIAAIVLVIIAVVMSYSVIRQRSDDQQQREYLANSRSTTRTDIMHMLNERSDPESLIASRKSFDIGDRRRSSLKSECLSEDTRRRLEAGREGSLPSPPKPLEFHDIIAQETLDRDKERAKHKKKLAEEKKEKELRAKEVLEKGKINPKLEAEMTKFYKRQMFSIEDGKKSKQSLEGKKSSHSKHIDKKNSKQKRGKKVSKDSVRTKRSESKSKSKHLSKATTRGKRKKKKQRNDSTDSKLASDEYQTYKE